MIFMSKRQIRVGHLDPDKLEGDTIYVLVRIDRFKYSDENEPTVQAMALSLERFRYGEGVSDVTQGIYFRDDQRYGADGKLVYRASTNDLQAKRLVDGDYEPFVDLLAQRNNCVVLLDFFRDGIRMHERLWKISRLANSG